MPDSNKYIDFDEYFRQGEPSKRETAFIWSTAIGLQAVDGLKTSEYLQETARRNIEGEITIEEAHKLIKEYCEHRQARTPEEENIQEADKVSSNIAKILYSPTIAFNVNGRESLAKKIGITPDGIKKQLDKLKKAGKIQHLGSTKKGHWKIIDN